MRDSSKVLKQVPRKWPLVTLSRGLKRQNPQFTYLIRSYQKQIYIWFVSYCHTSSLHPIRDILQYISFGHSFCLQVMKHIWYWWVKHRTNRNFFFLPGERQKVCKQKSYPVQHIFTILVAHFFMEVSWRNKCSKLHDFEFIKMLVRSEALI